MTLDDLRAQRPELGFAVYAYTPGAGVTLEVHTGDGQVFTFDGATEAAAIERAFPSSDVSRKPPAADHKVVAAATPDIALATGLGSLAGGVSETPDVFS